MEAVQDYQSLERADGPVRIDVLRCVRFPLRVSDVNFYERKEFQTRELRRTERASTSADFANKHTHGVFDL